MKFFVKLDNIVAETARIRKGGGLQFIFFQFLLLRGFALDGAAKFDAPVVNWTNNARVTAVARVFFRTLRREERIGTVERLRSFVRS